MAKVVTDNKHYTNIANVLRTHLGTDAKFKPSEMATEVEMCVSQAHTHGYNSGYFDGRSAEYDAFWDAFQNYGNRNRYIYGFAGSGWTADNFKPKYDIIMSGNNNYAFNSNAAQMDFAEYLESKGLKIDTSGMTSASEIFRLSLFTRLPKLDFSKAGSMYFTFRECAYLHTVDEIKVTASNTYNNTFYGCTNLVEIRFNGTIGNSIDFHWSAKLSFMSLASIVSALSKTVSGQTITLPTTARSTYDNATYSGRWDELVAEYPNWTFAYA